MHLFDLLEARGIEMDEYVLEKLTIFLVQNGPLIKTILAKCTMTIE